MSLQQEFQGKKENRTSSHREREQSYQRGSGKSRCRGGAEGTGVSSLELAETLRTGWRRTVAERRAVRGKQQPSMYLGQSVFRELHLCKRASSVGHIVMRSSSRGELERKQGGKRRKHGVRGGNKVVRGGAGNPWGHRRTAT